MSQIQVRFKGNFSDIDDIPVPTDVVNEEMETVAELTTSLKHPTIIPVPGPGTYLVRARLSSGELLSSTIKVAEGTADVTLDARDPAPREDLAWAYAVQGVARAAGQKSAPRRSSIRQAYPRYPGEFEVSVAVPTPESSAVWQVEFGRTWRVEEWNPMNGTWRLGPASGVTTGPDAGPDDDRMALFGHIERADLVQETRQWMPLWQEVVCEVPSGPMTMLVALPPLRTTHFAVVRTEERHRPVRCLARGGNARLDALASYLNQGAFDDARRLGAALQSEITELLEFKLEDPAAAVMAAYFLVRAGTVTHPRWIRNLADWFEGIADGPVLQAWMSLREPIRDDGEVRAHLLEAVRRGIPMYTWGLRLLYDGLNLLLQRQTDDELVSAFRAVRGVAAQADWKSLLTCTMPDSGVPWPFVEVEDEITAIPARGSVEQVLAAVWAELLGKERVGEADDFFILGGHSLLATQTISRLRATLGVELPMHALFEAPTVAELAQRLVAAVQTGESLLIAPPIVPVPRDGVLPLSFAQQRLWLIDQIKPKSPLYNISVALRLHGWLDFPALALSLSEVVRRHEVLRTVFEVAEGEPVQRILPPLPLFLPVADLSGLPAKEREALTQRLAEEEAQRSFDLRTGPVFRSGLLRLAQEEHALLLSMHHIASDGWSAGILVREVTALYGAFAAGRPSLLPELPIQYADYAVWQRRWLLGELLEREIAHWREALTGLPAVLDLPLDRPRPALQTFHGAVLGFRLPAELAGGLARLARCEAATLFMVLLAGFQALLGRLTGARDLAVGVPIAGRNRLETEELIGFFVNTLVMRGDLSGNPGLRELTARARERFLAAYAHQEVPFEKLVEELAPQRSLAHAPLFQTAFVFQGARQPAPELPGLTLSPFDAKVGTAKFDLTLSMSEGTEGLSGSLEHSTDLFDLTTVQRMARSFVRLLESAMSEPNRDIWDLPLLGPEEVHQLLREWNDTETEGLREASLAERFETEVARRPNALAAVFGDELLSYGELNARANRLARHLRGFGVGPEVRVGLLLDRSASFLVGLLAVIKAGGAYVPLDPSYPPQRLTFMAQDASLSVLVTEERLAGSIPGVASVEVRLDRDSETIAQRPAENLGVRVSGEGLAYVMYTSGSTGIPRGICIPQRGIARLVLKTNYVVLGPEDRIGLLSNTSFDASTFEIWGALLNGACLVDIPQEVVLSQEDLAAVLERQRITTAHLTTALFQQRAVSVPGAFTGLRNLLFGGEAADPVRVREATLEGNAPQRLLHMYGPTQCTTFTTFYQVRSVPAGARNVPIGGPISTAAVYLLDPWLQPVPAGVVGEMYIGGEGLARGYLGRPDLTAERFVPDFFSGRLGERLYRTGDLCRHLAGGEVEILGRADHQVNLRGGRIELGEVEAALAWHPAVREAVVIVREDVPRERRLVAYVVPAGDLAGLRESLIDRLPDYMVPAVIVELPALPLTPNGKVDRIALPAPDGSQLPGSGTYVEPGTELERQIASTVEKLLGIGRVGRDDDFFDLGANSLLVVRIAGALTEVLRRQIQVIEVFRFPNVGALARHLSQGEDAPISREVHDKRLVERSKSKGRLHALRQGSGQRGD